ncbi:hypothetical protein B0O99DRAFT_625701 [Bisporella sp. PMI_857]|nr:hypothetical protein B0O99DRAFT_625701 [Bisporella sp. PMI_857]
MGNRDSSSFLGRIQRMCTRFPVRDPSYLAAIFFLLGASFFTINGFLYVFATAQPGLKFNANAIPASSCVGDFFFFLGCTAAIVESLNTGRVKYDGSVVIEGAVRPRHIQASDKHEALESGSPVEKEIPLKDLEAGLSTPTAHVTSKIVLIGDPSFTWFPPIADLRKHYIRDVAFVASVISWTGIIFFTIATIAYIPGVANLNDINVYYYLALLPTFLGGTFFLIAALMQTSLTQKKWYIPAPNRLCWVCSWGCLWYAGESAYWAATLASFWGAWGWFLGSLTSWYIIMENY